MLPPFLSSIVNDVDIVLNQVMDDFVVVKTTTICQVVDYSPPPSTYGMLTYSLTVCDVTGPSVQQKNVPN
jgi:hypothetical protein